jgi:hypothetical protein
VPIFPWQVLYDDLTDSTSLSLSWYTPLSIHTVIDTVTPLRPYSRPPYSRAPVLPSTLPAAPRHALAQPGLDSAHICAGTGCAHVCARTGTPTSAPGLAVPTSAPGPARPHLRRDWHAHICAGTGTPTSAPGPADPPTSAPGPADPPTSAPGPSRCRRRRRSIGS